MDVNDPNVPLLTGNTPITGKNSFTTEPSKAVQGPVQGPIQPAMALPSPPIDSQGDFSQRGDAYSAMVYAQYHTDMLNAGADVFLQGFAQQRFNLNASKVEAWKRNVNDKFTLVNQDETLTPIEKEMVRNAVMNKSQEPIYIPTMQDYPTPKQQMERKIADRMSGLIGGGVNEPAPGTGMAGLQNAADNKPSGINQNTAEDLAIGLNTNMGYIPKKNASDLSANVITGVATMPDYMPKEALTIDDVNTIKTLDAASREGLSRIQRMGIKEITDMAIQRIKKITEARKVSK